jgi:hypothetical protein
MFNSGHTPIWGNASHTIVNLTVALPSGEEIPLGACANYDMAYGRDLFARAVAGEFGPIAEYVAPVKTPEQIQAEMVATVQKHLDDTAKTRGYDGILSLASYASSTHPPFSAEGQAGLDWRDAVWGYCYQVLADVQAQTRTIPTAAELIAELPVMVWP